MTATPEPPAEGWTLPEAAAALFPDAWSAAWFPDDVTAARARPGIERSPSPWSQVAKARIAATLARVGQTQGATEDEDNDTSVVLGVG